MKNVDIVGIGTKQKAFRSAAFDRYMQDGGFPELLSIEDSRTYINDLVHNILQRDIEQRYSISYKTAFEQMAQHLLNISPAKVVSKELAEIFHIKSEHTAKNYVGYLKQAYLLLGVSKYSAKSKLRVTQEKLYAVDVALMNKRQDAMAAENMGWRLETIVMISLMRRCRMNGWDLYYLDERSSECDFVVCDGSNALQAIQVSFDISNQKTFNREVNGLMAAAKRCKCRELILLTDHEYGTHNVDGFQINIMPVSDWLLEL